MTHGSVRRAGKQVAPNPRLEADASSCFSEGAWIRATTTTSTPGLVGLARLLDQTGSPPGRGAPWPARPASLFDPTRC